MQFPNISSASGSPTVSTTQTIRSPATLSSTDHTPQDVSVTCRWDSAIMVCLWGGPGWQQKAGHSNKGCRKRKVDWGTCSLMALAASLLVPFDVYSGDEEVNNIMTMQIEKGSFWPYKKQQRIIKALTLILMALVEWWDHNLDEPDYLLNTIHKCNGFLTPIALWHYRITAILCCLADRNMKAICHVVRLAPEAFLW